jgi:NTP pyrophosphatase (non-canonical NTP hydrolase)
MEYNVTGLNKLSKDLNKFQIDAGFTDANITQRLMLSISEISEAFEAYRKDRRASKVNFELCADNDEFKYLFEKEIKDTLEDEMADAIIRLVAFCGENDIDIEKHIQLKMKYNHLRGYKFGGKKF